MNIKIIALIFLLMSFLTSCATTSMTDHDKSDISVSSSIIEEKEFIFNSETNTITIELKGKMKYNCENAPWRDIKYPENIVLKKGITSISDWGFGCQWGDDDGPMNFNYWITTVKIPDSVKTIGADAFWHCSNLEKINLPNSVTKIGHDAFGECEKLSKVKLSQNLETIKRWAFGNCPKINEITIPKSVKKIGNNAFGYIDFNTRIKDFTIKGYKGTAAEKYAKKNGFKFVALD